MISTGTYYPNKTGARTLADALPLYVGEQRVSVVVEENTVTLFRGGEIVLTASRLEFESNAQLAEWANENAENPVEQTDDNTVWVPVSGGQEAEMTLGEAARIATDTNRIRSLNYAREFSQARAIRAKLMEWAVNEKGLDITSRDLGRIRDWWFSVGEKESVKRGLAAVAAYQSARTGQ